MALLLRCLRGRRAPPGRDRRDARPGVGSGTSGVRTVASFFRAMAALAALLLLAVVAQSPLHCCAQKQNKPHLVFFLADGESWNLVRCSPARGASLWRRAGEYAFKAHLRLCTSCCDHYLRCLMRAQTTGSQTWSNYIP